MSPEVGGALVGGILSGLVVLSALALERRLSHRAAQRERRHVAVANALRVYLTAMAENVRAHGEGDKSTMHRAGAELLGATGQLAVLGPVEIVDALIAFDRTGKQMGTRASQDALLTILEAIRSEVLPEEPPLPPGVLRDLLFESPTAPGETSAPTTPS